jgi:hypothetical protein
VSEEDNDIFLNQMERYFGRTDAEKAKDVR